MGFGGFTSAWSLFACSVAADNASAVSPAVFAELTQPVDVIGDYSRASALGWCAGGRGRSLRCFRAYRRARPTRSPTSRRPGGTRAPAAAPSRWRCSASALSCGAVPPRRRRRSRRPGCPDRARHSATNRRVRSSEARAAASAPSKASSIASNAAAVRPNSVSARVGDSRPPHLARSA